MEQLCPVADDSLSTRLVERLGGTDVVRAEARQAISTDPRWAAQLLAWLDAADVDGLDALHADAYEAVAETVGNTNGRGMLLQAAHERREGVKTLGEPTLSPGFMSGIPLTVLFDKPVCAVAPRGCSRGARVGDVRVPRCSGGGHRHRSPWRRRGGVGGGAAPHASTDRNGHRRQANLAFTGPSTTECPKALASGRLAIAGDSVAFLAFLDRFDRGLMARAPPPP